MAVSFLNFLYSHAPLRVGEDGLRWRLKRIGLFDICSFCTAIRGSPRVIFPWNSIWCVKAPRRVCIFVWSAAWDKVLTCDNLMH